MRPIVLVFSLIISASWELVHASGAEVGITLRVPEIRFLSLANSDRFVHLAEATNETGGVGVQLLAGPSRTTTVTLISRSNTSYRLRVKLQSSADVRLQQPILVTVKSVDVNLGTANLMPDARSVRTIPGELYTPIDELVIVEGPRISRAGNNMSIDNAIRITLNIEFPDSLSEAVLLFTMGP